MRISDKEDGLTHQMPAPFVKWIPTGRGESACDDVTTISFTYRTDPEKIRLLIPEESGITEPFIMISCQKYNVIHCMGGSEYSVVTVSTPARYLETKEPVDGLFHHVLRENKAAPILGGREESDMPKVRADIPGYRRVDQYISVNINHEGRAFLKMDLIEEHANSPDEIANMNENNSRINQLGWRYIPKAGSVPGAALSEATCYPLDNEIFSGSVCNDSIRWTLLKPKQHPMQFQIISALADLPILETLPGYFRKEGSGCVTILQVHYHEVE
jgi:hypothetical protein